MANVRYQSDKGKDYIKQLEDKIRQSKKLYPSDWLS